MDLPIGAEVSCADGPCGRSTKVILNPVTERVTHLVIREREFPHTEFLVPLELLVETSPTTIRLRCDGKELRQFDHFNEVEYLPAQEPYLSYGMNDYMLWPYATLAAPMIPLEHECIPPGELAVSRHARVDASDGHVGRVDEFLIDPASGHITHLVLREGHLWGQKDVTIPVSAIARIDEGTVHLALNKEALAALPAIPARRR